MIARFEAGSAGATPELVCAALVDVADAECGVADTPEARVAAKSRLVRGVFGIEQSLMKQCWGSEFHSVTGPRSLRVKAQVELLTECRAAGVPAPDWPLLPKGSPDGDAAKMIDELDGYYVVADWPSLRITDTPTIGLVRLSGDAVNDETIFMLRELSRLTNLQLHDTRVTDDGVAALKKHLPDIVIERSDRVQP